MSHEPPQTVTAFAGNRRIAQGACADVAAALRRRQADHPQERILVFDDSTGAQTDFDLSGSEAAVRSRYAPRRAGAGRPKLGVVAKEVTLLPRHWEWLAMQPGGASAALRRLVDAARKGTDGPAARRARQSAAYRFMSAIAGDLPGFEEASRALFADDSDRLRSLVAGWPADVRDHALKLAGL